jgi:hypothetical protein
VNISPGEQAAIDQGVAAVINEVHHYATVYRIAIPLLGATEALELSAKHILGHNRGISEEAWAAEMAVAARVVHDLRHEIEALRTQHAKEKRAAARVRRAIWERWSQSTGGDLR